MAATLSESTSFNTKNPDYYRSLSVTSRMHRVHPLEPPDGTGNQAGKHVPKKAHRQHNTDFNHRVYSLFEKRKCSRITQRS